VTTYRPCPNCAVCGEPVIEGPAVFVRPDGKVGRRVTVHRRDCRRREPADAFALIDWRKVR